MGESAIEWTEQTWNPTTGCDRISPGCDNCYALTLAARLKSMGQARYQKDGDPRTSGPGFGLTEHPDALGIPLKRRKPTMWFVNSMSDLFHKDVDPWFIARVWAVMANTPQHTYQILTKRPKRMRKIVTTMGECWTHARPFPLSNVWLGTSIESDDYVWRADHLRETPAAIRFISAEPLLGPLPSLELDGIDWLIVGGESGPNHRPIETQWVRDLRDACDPGGHWPPTTAFFFKQWGGRTPKSGGRELDGRTWDEMPGVETAVVS